MLSAANGCDDPEPARKKPTKAVEDQDGPPPVPSPTLPTQDQELLQANNTIAAIQPQLRKKETHILPKLNMEERLGLNTVIGPCYFNCRVNNRLANFGLESTSVGKRSLILRRPLAAEPDDTNVQLSIAASRASRGPKI